VSIRRQIGNAVPSLLAEVLAREIRRQLLGAPMEGPLKLAVRRRRATLAPERVHPVPGKYLDMVGNHPDHPGEGRGPRAARKLIRGVA
jgi:DNA (cytosine-5)-methyltransferase 1